MATTLLVAGQANKCWQILSDSRLLLLAKNGQKQNMLIVCRFPAKHFNCVRRDAFGDFSLALQQI